MPLLYGAVIQSCLSDVAEEARVGGVLSLLQAAVTDATKRALRLFGRQLGGNMADKEVRTMLAVKGELLTDRRRSMGLGREHTRHAGMSTALKLPTRTQVHRVPFHIPSLASETFLCRSWARIVRGRSTVKNMTVRG